VGNALSSACLPLRAGSRQADQAALPQVALRPRQV
jgi:hypothetical protein